MAVYKCKMCGATLNIESGKSVAECEYCGSVQTLPKLDDDRRANLFDRANHFRRNNEFDKAIAIFEQILNEDKSDAEAYWSLVLCAYGIEYVEDPMTRKRIPTIHRAQFTSIFDDENYKSALEYADSYQREIYEKEAKAINEIQKSILEISQKEDPFDVFICYKETDSAGRRTPDSVLANELYHELTNQGFKVFFSRITLEDKLGSAYEPYIFAALNSAKVMVVLGTKPEYFNAVWVKNEWSRFLALIKGGAKKTLIPAYKDMDAYDLPNEFAHLQAQDMSKLGFVQDLIRGINKIAKEPKKNENTTTTIINNVGGSNIDTLLERMFMFLEDGKWSDANNYAEKVLDANPKCAKAYLGKLMVDTQVKKTDCLFELENPFDTILNYQKFVQFATHDEQAPIKKQLQEIKDRNKENSFQAICSKLDSNDIEDLKKAIDGLANFKDYKDGKEKRDTAKDKLNEILTNKIDSYSTTNFEEIDSLENWVYLYRNYFPYNTEYINKAQTKLSNLKAIQPLIVPRNKNKAKLKRLEDEYEANEKSINSSNIAYGFMTLNIVLALICVGTFAFSIYAIIEISGGFTALAIFAWIFAIILIVPIISTIVGEKKRKSNLATSNVSLKKEIEDLKKAINPIDKKLKNLGIANPDELKVSEYYFLLSQLDEIKEEYQTSKDEKAATKKVESLFNITYVTAGLVLKCPDPSTLYGDFTISVKTFPKGAEVLLEEIAKRNSKSVMTSSNEYYISANSFKEFIETILELRDMGITNIFAFMKQ